MNGVRTIRKYSYSLLHSLRRLLPVHCLRIWYISLPSDLSHDICFKIRETQSHSYSIYCFSDFSMFSPSKGHVRETQSDSGVSVSSSPISEDNVSTLIQPLCCWWLIWPIQNYAKNLKNDGNPGTWVLI